MNKKPTNFAHAMILLDAVVGKNVKEQIKTKDEKSIGSQLHFTLGLWIRNNWIHNNSSPLSAYLDENAMGGPDDLSLAIIRMFHRYLNKKDLKIIPEMKSIYWMSDYNDSFYERFKS